MFPTLWYGITFYAQSCPACICIYKHSKFGNVHAVPDTVKIGHPSQLCEIKPISDTAMQISACLIHCIFPRKLTMSRQLNQINYESSFVQRDWEKKSTETCKTKWWTQWMLAAPTFRSIHVELKLKKKLKCATALLEKTVLCSPFLYTCL